MRISASSWPRQIEKKNLLREFTIAVSHIYHGTLSHHTRHAPLLKIPVWWRRAASLPSLGVASASLFKITMSNSTHPLAACIVAKKHDLTIVTKRQICATQGLRRAGGPHLPRAAELGIGPPQAAWRGFGPGTCPGCAATDCTPSAPSAPCGHQCVPGPADYEALMARPVARQP